MRKICFYPELVMVTGSVNAALMMSQLEFWFKKTGGKSFYKFLEPCDHGYYKVGDSWQEELMMSSSELRTAFKHIGIAYKSKRAFMEHERDIFQGKMYASYYDRIRKVTYYFRNAGKVTEIFRGLEEDKQLENEQLEKLDKEEGEIDAMDSSALLTSGNPESAVRILYIPNALNNTIQNNIQDKIQNKTVSKSLKTRPKLNTIKDKREESDRDSNFPFEEICKLYNDQLGVLLGRKDSLSAYEKACVRRLCGQLGKGVEEFKRVFAKTAESNFLCGRIEGKSFRATLTWLLKEKHFSKVLSGDYDDFSQVKTCKNTKMNWKEKVETKVQKFNEMDSREWDFDEIERLERAYIDRKLEQYKGLEVCMG